MTVPDANRSRPQVESEWIDAPIPAAAERLSAAGIDPTLAVLLGRRGVETAAEAAAFLDPSLDALHEPGLLTGMDEAVRLLLDQRGGPPIVIVGDYDVDGVSSTALVLATLGACGVEADPILPHRQRDGYGLQPVHVERAVERGARVLLTLDCGTSAHESIALAVASGLRVIVVDHHLPGEAELPEAILVNPRQPDCGYPFPDLAAAGLSFKLALALSAAAERPVPVEALLRIACLGTIADMVPLRGENRVIAALGLRALAETRSRGLKALFEEARIRPPFESADVGFRIGPRLNAAGRVGAADPALELLMTRDEARAKELATMLEESNRDRRAEEKRVVEEAIERIEEREEIPAILVEWDPSWHRGVVGIAASRISKRYRRPTLLFQVEGDRASGSGRSVPGIELFHFLAPWRERLERFGGHAQAVGLTVATERLDDLRREWELEAAYWPDETRLRRWEIELSLRPEQVDHELWRDLSRLEPYGMDNPQPLVKVGPLSLESSRPFGKGHLRGRARGPNGGLVTLLGWGWEERLPELSGQFEAIGHIEKDRYYGGIELRLLEVRDLV